MKRLFPFLLICTVTYSYAQSIQQDTPAQDSLRSWHLKDKKTDGLAGISLKQAYEFLKGKKSTPIVVAVIDSGIDTLHEDLKGVLWTNQKEIPNNGIDEDGNGYVDDVHGWNFLGNKNGAEVEKASSEKARVYHSLKTIYLDKKIDTNKLTKQQLYQYKMWQRAAVEIEPNPENVAQATALARMGQKLHEWDSLVITEAKVKDYNTAELEALIVKSEDAKRAKMGLLNLLKAMPFGADARSGFVFQALKDETDRLNSESEEKEKEPIDVHQTMIKDNYNDFSDNHYGNNNIMGKTSMHGTHVSGIIAADRTNKVGINGIADNVKIMMIRAVPDGDEYDKDIALAIRYAVDNGAKVINMSFGKSYSPQKQWVDEAFQYAASKDVLLVHAAGNEGRNIDTAYNFPSTTFLNGIKAQNVLTVSASSDKALTSNYVAGFSNYGKQNSDVFAPGVSIYSTLPGGNNYGNLDGTSMASPVAAGIAALVRSYYPSLTALQTKAVIEKSVTMIEKDALSYKPGSENQTSLSDLCRSGGIVNALGALTEADKMVNEKSENHQKKRSKSK